MGNGINSTLALGYSNAQIFWNMNNLKMARGSEWPQGMLLVAQNDRKLRPVIFEIEQDAILLNNVTFN